MASKTILSQKYNNEITHYSKLLKSAGIPFIQLILFGSHAKGTAKTWSDLDICVVSKSFGKNRFDERLKLMKIIDDESIDIEPHPFSPSDLNDKWDPLAYEIRKYGITI